MSLTQRLYKYSIHGASFSGLVAFSTSDSRSDSFFTSKANLSFTDAQVPTWLFSFGVGFLSSAFSDLAASYVLPYVSQDAQMKNRESMLLALGVSAASAYALISLLNPVGVGAIGSLNILGGAAGAEILAGWLTSFLNGADSQGY